MLSNMPAELLIDERHVLDARAFVETVVWRVPRPTRGSTHRFKVSAGARRRWDLRVAACGLTPLGLIKLVEADLT